MEAIFVNVRRGGPGDEQDEIQARGVAKGEGILRIIRIGRGEKDAGPRIFCWPGGATGVHGAAVGGD